MEYMAIEARNVDELIKEVNDEIKNGWEPLGGVSISLSESDDYQYLVVAQALIKNK